MYVCVSVVYQYVTHLNGWPGSLQRIDPIVQDVSTEHVYVHVYRGKTRAVITMLTSVNRMLSHILNAPVLHRSKSKNKLKAL